MADICIVAGSLRRGSYNRGVARICEQMSGGELFNLSSLPLFSQDYEIKGQEPDCLPAQELRSSLRRADGVVLVTPEYDGYPSGVIINALNWCSRPPDWPLNEKPVAVLSASPSPRGGRRAQHHLRQMLEKMGALALEPMLCIDARQGFSSDGSLTDPEKIHLVEDQIKALEAFAASQG